MIAEKQVAKDEFKLLKEVGVRMAYQKFTDKSSAENYKNGIEYLAVGLIAGCHMENGVPSKSGKDYAVEYIDPFGVYHHTWRGSDDIEVSAISEEDYQSLKACYELLQVD